LKNASEAVKISHHHAESSKNGHKKTKKDLKKRSGIPK